MNTLQTVAALAFGFTLAGSAMAQSYPHQECWIEDVAVSAPPQARSNMGMVIGGIAGGILGSEVGGGRGNVVATAAGAVIGAITGERLDNPQQQQPQNAVQQRVQRCRMVY